VRKRLKIQAPGVVRTSTFPQWQALQSPALHPNMVKVST
jgi:hypothetical protein